MRWTAPNGQAGTQVWQPKQRATSITGRSPRSNCMSARALQARRAWHLSQV